MTSPPSHVGPLEVITGCAGASVISTFVLAVSLVQLFPSVIMTEYVPAFALVIFVNTGSSNVDVKLFGPVHSKV